MSNILYNKKILVLTANEVNECIMEKFRNKYPQLQDEEFEITTNYSDKETSFNVFTIKD